jgi:hypothetical protein
MHTDRSTRYWPYAAGALLVVAIGWATLFRHVEDDQKPRAAAAASTGSSNAGVASNKAAAVASATRAPSAASRAAAVTYEHSDNLLAIAQAGEGKSDPASLGLRARALQECQALADTPDYFAKFDTDGPALYGDKFPIVRRQVDTYLKRCGALANAAKAAETKAAIEEAAKAGNVWADAMMFPQESRARPSAEVDAHLQNILASHDPYAIGALADEMAGQLTDSRFSDLAGSPLSGYAWLLASCELGRDCTSNGQLMREACIFAGLCGAATDFHALLKDSVLSADELSRVESVEQSILDTIRTGVH